MLEQIIIAITGVAAIWLTQQNRESWKQYACFFGMLGEPFWLYTTYINEQWGMFGLSLFYTYAWYLGFSNYWLKRKSYTTQAEVA